MESSHFSALFDFVSKTDSNIIVFDIILMETVHNYEKNLREKSIELQKSLRNVNRLISQNKINLDLKIDVEYLVEKYEASFIDKLRNISWNPNWEVFTTPNRFFKPIIERSVRKEKPFQENGKGFKDAIIWECLKYFVSEVNSLPNAFISTNSSDFGGDGKLFPVLLEELNKSGSSLLYYNSIQEFLNENGEKISFITLEWILENIDLSLLNDHIISSINQNDRNKKLILKNHVKEGDYGRFRAQEIKHLEIFDFTVYSFHESFYLLSLMLSFKVHMTDGRETIIVKYNLLIDSIYEGNKIDKFSPPEFE